jgi:hypothetical protein
VLIYIYSKLVLTKSKLYSYPYYFFTRLNHTRSALIYLEKALELEGECGDKNSTKADTHNNTCAVLSQMGRHDLAMHHA